MSERFALLVVAGPDTGATFSSSGERAVIGTLDACDLVLHDSTVSRFHCEIDAAAPRPLLRDLGSLNGTSVNGVGVVLAELSSGAVLTVGRSQVRFDLAAGAAEPRAAGRGLDRAAAGDGIVLLEGPGARAAAERLHAAGPRARGPLLVVDCAALPGELLERELFGVSSEGGGEARPGAFEAAAGGTLFLDEIGELPLELQPRLLRVLDKREVRRNGATTTVAVDARVIAATARNLRCDVNAKKLRSDLYVRLAATTVRLPPREAELGDRGDAHEPWLRARERRWLEALLAARGGDAGAAADDAAVEPADFARLLRRHGL